MNLRKMNLMQVSTLAFWIFPLGLGLNQFAVADAPITDSHITFSPYNWHVSGQEFAQTANPGAYLKVGFTGTKITVGIDVSPLTSQKVPAAQYPVIRYSVDGGPATTVQLGPSTNSIPCASGLSAGSHRFRLQYVAGYVFLDFWTPVNVLRVTGFGLDQGAMLTTPTASEAVHPRNSLFLGDSITNGDDDVATFTGGITNAVDTQDATLGYPSIVAAGIDSEYGVVAYGGASWDGTAADGHTPGLLSSYSNLDARHSRLKAGKLTPIPDDIFINMGENAGPTGSDVPNLLAALRSASSPKTNIFVIVPFSGRARSELTAGITAYLDSAPSDKSVFLLDLGSNPYLTDAGSTMLSVDGQHPLAALHATLGAQIVQARSILLSCKALK